MNFFVDICQWSNYKKGMCPPKYESKNSEWLGWFLMIYSNKCDIWCLVQCLDAVQVVPSLSAGIHPACRHYGPLSNLISLPFVSNGHIFFFLTFYFSVSVFFPISCFFFISLSHSFSHSQSLPRPCHPPLIILCVFYMSPSHPLTFPISASPFLFPLASLSAFLSLTELFQRCLEYIWLCDSSGQHHWHPGDRAWGKCRNLPCVLENSEL